MDNLLAKPSTVRMLTRMKQYCCETWRQNFGLPSRLLEWGKEFKHKGEWRVLYTSTGMVGMCWLDSGVTNMITSMRELARRQKLRRTAREESAWEGRRGKPGSCTGVQLRYAWRRQNGPNAQDVHNPTTLGKVVDSALQLATRRGLHQRLCEVPGSCCEEVQGSARFSGATRRFPPRCARRLCSTTSGKAFPKH
ncbi:hypothetical protein RI054_36g137930 [Pseudoscourfieldia marina]